jgi:hypothetical protein
MAMNDFILNGLVQMETLLNNPTFSWKGETFGCIPNTLTNGVTNSTVMFEESDDFRMTVRNNQFTPNITPQPNDYLYYNGFQLLVKQVKYMSHGVYNIYICSNPTIKSK